MSRHESIWRVPGKALLVALSVSTLLIGFEGCSLKPSPEEAYKKIVGHVENKRWGEVYDSIDSYSKGQLDTSLKMLTAFASAFSGDKGKNEIANLSGRDLFIRLAETNAQPQDALAKSGYELLKTSKQGDRATLAIREKDGTLRDVILAWEGKSWKLVLSGSNLAAKPAPTENVQPSSKPDNPAAKKPSQGKNITPPASSRKKAKSIGLIGFEKEYLPKVLPPLKKCTVSAG